MLQQTVLDEYAQALKLGQKEYRELVMAGKPPYPAVLDEILPENGVETVVDVGLVEIPAERIIGVKSAGRITAFTPSFRPLLDVKSEFGSKWTNLCKAHLGDTGITDPILCYEYLGNFYVQEGNKRVSVLRHFDAPRIPGNVKRVLPDKSDDPRIVAYYEFIEFYKCARIYDIQFRRPGDYAKLLNYMGKKSGEVWSENDQRTFRAYFLYFRDAFAELHTEDSDILPEEALLLWLELYPYQDLGCLSTGDLKKSVAALREDFLTSLGQKNVTVQTKAEDAEKPGLINRLFSGVDTLHVAFVHQLDAAQSAWVTGHEAGRKHIEEVFGDRITVQSYYGANSHELAEEKIRQAVEDGAEVVFTTAPLSDGPP